MTTTTKDRFTVTLTFSDIVSVLMVKKAIQDAISAQQESQDRTNFSENESIIRNLKKTLEQVNSYKPVVHKS